MQIELAWSPLHRIGATIAMCLLLTLWCTAAHVGSFETAQIGAALHWATVMTVAWSTGLAWIWRRRALLCETTSRGRSARPAAIGRSAAVLLCHVVLVFLLDRILSSGWPEPIWLAERAVAFAPAAFAAVMILAFLSRDERDARPEPDAAARQVPAMPVEDALFLHLPEEPGVAIRNRDIRWISSAANYCEFQLQHRTVLVRVPISRLEERLRDHGFLRVHRKRIVNLAIVSAVLPGPGGTLVLEADGGELLPVARSYRPLVLERLSTLSSLHE